MPFGETRFTTGAMKTDKLFTGQREITRLGIYHYRARFYSPKLGRFLSADTIVPGSTITKYSLNYSPNDFKRANRSGSPSASEESFLKISYAFEK